jgi:hypothetical protein
MSNKIIQPELKSGLSQREQLINKMVDEFIPNDYINQLMEKYSEELKYYTYIDTVYAFSTLKLKGSMKYINKYDKQLRYGGLLVKIYQENNNWYGVILKTNNKKYYVSFKSNYIFYCENIGQLMNDNMRNELQLFISDIDKGNYELV